MWLTKIFWFSQPAESLIIQDKYLLWLFAVITVLGLILIGVSRFARNAAVAKLISKFSSASLWMGIVGLFWFALRYENTPIFADRYWAAMVIGIYVIWIIFIVKYLFTKFGSEKREYEKAQLNSRYIPGPR